MTDERAELARYYESLSPEERRARILLQPAYRDAYNEITRAHEVVSVPGYFWANWVPILGPTSSLLYLRLRQLCYYQPGSPEHRDYCWPRQDELAASIGFKKRDTIRIPLIELEGHGFIKRESAYVTDQATRVISRRPDRYLVFFEVPLTPADAAELLIRASGSHMPEKRAYEAPQLSCQPDRMPEKRANVYARETGIRESVCPKNGHTEESSEVPDPEQDRGEIEVCQSGRMPATRAKNVERSTSSTFNVDMPAKRAYGGNADPEGLAEEMVEELGDPGSEKWYRYLADRVPEILIRLALSETKAARLEGYLRGKPGAYFTGAVKRIAAERGVSL